MRLNNADKTNAKLMKENRTLNENYININNEFKNLKKLNDDYLNQINRLS
jgi:hypothetical protein